MSKVYEVYRSVYSSGYIYVRANSEKEAENAVEDMDFEEVGDVTVEVNEVTEDELKKMDESDIIDATKRRKHK